MMLSLTEIIRKWIINVNTRWFFSLMEIISTIVRVLCRLPIVISLSIQFIRHHLSLAYWYFLCPCPNLMHTIPKMPKCKVTLNIDSRLKIEAVPDLCVKVLFRSYILFPLPNLVHLNNRVPLGKPYVNHIFSPFSPIWSIPHKKVLVGKGCAVILNHVFKSNMKPIKSLPPPSPQSD